MIGIVILRDIWWTICASNSTSFFLPLGSSNQYDSLLGSEPSSLGINPCLDILLTENILSHVLAASRMPISQDQQDQLRLEQLKMYEVLLDQTSARARSLLGHQPFLRPLLEVLNELRYFICRDVTLGVQK